MGSFSVITGCKRLNMRALPQSWMSQLTLLSHSLHPVVLCSHSHRVCFLEQRSTKPSSQGRRCWRHNASGAVAFVFRKSLTVVFGYLDDFLIQSRNTRVVGRACQPSRPAEACAVSW